MKELQTVMPARKTQTAILPLPPDELRDLYRKMLTIRIFEETVFDVYRKGMDARSCPPFRWTGSHPGGSVRRSARWTTPSPAPTAATATSSPRAVRWNR